MVQERHDKGVEESVMLSKKSHVNEINSLVPSYVKHKQLEAKQAIECLVQVEKGQKRKDLELERITAKLQRSKKWAEEAQKVAADSTDSRCSRASLACTTRMSFHWALPIPLIYSLRKIHMCLTSTMKTCTKGLPIKVKEVDLAKLLGKGKALDVSVYVYC